MFSSHTFLIIFIALMTIDMYRYWHFLRGQNEFAKFQCLKEEDREEDKVKKNKKNVFFLMNLMVQAFVPKAEHTQSIKLTFLSIVGTCSM